jgi:TonB family protein
MGARSRLDLALFLAASGLLHQLLAIGVLLSPETPRPARIEEQHAVELVDPAEVDRPFTLAPGPIAAADLPREEREVEARARVGDPWARGDEGAADTLAELLEAPGSPAGQGRPRPHTDPLAGEDLDDLRSRPFNHAERDTPNRIRTAKEAVTHDNSRATPNPGPTPMLTTGKGRGSVREDARGVGHRDLHGLVPSTRGRSGASLLEEGASPEDQVVGRGRIEELAKGQGGRSSSGEGLEEQPGRARTRLGREGEPLARVPRDGVLSPPPATLRPELDRGVPSTLSSNRAEAVADVRNRELASSARVPDLLDMGRPRGDGDSSGKGRGAAAGRRGDPTGGRDGRAIWLSNPDRKYVRYFRDIYRKVQPMWIFPKDLEILMEQGEVLVGFTILKSGEVSDIRIQRSSGHPRFDQIVAAAIRKAAPFGRIPDGLGERLKVLAPFEFANPLVR